MDTQSGVAELAHCMLCPRECGVDRLHGQKGVCGVPGQLLAARASLHRWEEPCLSGSRGSGTVFFSGCGLGCIYCQNYSISLEGQGVAMSVQDLADTFLKLQEQGAHNINLVTAVPYLPQVILALERVKGQSLTIPVIYNSSGYEKVESLRRLEGLVDIYLPDFKYMDAERARRYSRCAGLSRGRETGPGGNGAASTGGQVGCAGDDAVRHHRPAPTFARGTGRLHGRGTLPFYYLWTSDLYESDESVYSRVSRDRVS